MKEFIFSNTSDEENEILITILAYSLEKAFKILIKTAKHPADFSCIKH